MNADRCRWKTLVIAVMLPSVYVISFGPVSWIVQRTESGRELFRLFYWPVGALGINGPYAVQRAVCSYAETVVDRDINDVFIPISPNSNGYLILLRRQKARVIRGGTQVMNHDSMILPRIELTDRDFE